MATGLRGISLAIAASVMNVILPATAVVLGEGCELDLDAVDSVDAVDEEDENENEGNLKPRQTCRECIVPVILPSCHTAASQ